MAWRAIAVDEVLAEVTPMEAALIENIGGGKFLPGILANVVAQVRGQIKGGGNQVDQSNAMSIPDQVRDDVTCLARWKWFLKLGKLPSLQTPERREAAQNAEKRFAMLAAYGDPKRERIELPETADTTPAAVPLPSTGRTKPKIFTAKEQDGIV